MISEIFAHSPYLAVQPLCEDDPEALFSRPFHKAWSGHRIKNRNTFGHSFEKPLINFSVNCHKIFFFVIISRTHDPVYKISLIRHQKKPFGFFIKPANRVHTDGIFQKFCDSSLFLLFFCAAHNPSWFVKKKQYSLFFFFNRFPIHTDKSICIYPFTGLYHLSVYGYPPRLRHPVSFSAGTDSCIT